MSMSIILSDQAAEIVRANLVAYGSAEAFIESAIFKIHADDRLHEDSREDTEFIKYLNAAIAEAEADDSPSIEWDPEEIKREGRRQLAASMMEK